MIQVDTLSIANIQSTNQQVVLIMLEREDEQISIHACNNCDCDTFYMIVGGGLICSNCNYTVTAYWIHEEGVVSESKLIN